MMLKKDEMLCEILESVVTAVGVNIPYYSARSILDKVTDYKIYCEKKQDEQKDEHKTTNLKCEDYNMLKYKDMMIERLENTIRELNQKIAMYKLDNTIEEIKKNKKK